MDELTKHERRMTEQNNETINKRVNQIITVVSCLCIVVFVRSITTQVIVVRGIAVPGLCRGRFLRHTHRRGLKSVNMMVARNMR